MVRDLTGKGQLRVQILVRSGWGKEEEGGKGKRGDTFLRHCEGEEDQFRGVVVPWIFEAVVRLGAEMEICWCLRFKAVGRFFRSGPNPKSSKWELDPRFNYKTFLSELTYHFSSWVYLRTQQLRPCVENGAQSYAPSLSFLPANIHTNVIVQSTLHLEAHSSVLSHQDQIDSSFHQVSKP